MQDKITDSLLMAVPAEEIKKIANSHKYTPKEYLQFKHLKIREALVAMMDEYKYSELESLGLTRLMNHRRNSISILESQLRDL